MLKTGLRFFPQTWELNQIFLFNWRCQQSHCLFNYITHWEYWASILFISNEKLALYLCFWSQRGGEKGDWWALSTRGTLMAFINYMFSWTPAVASTHSQTNFLLRCSKATANLHIHLMLFKKISRFLIYYLVSFSCFTRWSSISTRMMIRSPAKNTYH